MVSEDNEEVVKTTKKKSKKQVKRKPVLFDSDSDGDFVEKSPPSPKKAKRKKKGLVPDSGQVSIADAFKRIQSKSSASQPVLTFKPKEKSKVEKPKEQGGKGKTQISASDFFGVEPVKREEQKSKKRKVDEEILEDYEIHDDDDFEQTLAQLDQKNTPKKMKVEEAALKEDKQQTLASKLATKLQENKTMNNDDDKYTKITKKVSSDDVAVSKSETLKKTPRKSSRKTEEKTPKKVEVTPPKKTPRKSPVNTKTTQSKKVTPKKSPIKMEITPPAKKSPAESKKEISPPAKTSPAKSKKETPEKDSAAEKPVLQRKTTGYRAYLHREGPRNLGSKEIPEGGENCLEGLTFVVTGVLESLERDETKSLVERYGGKVTGNVSRKTSYVVVGRDAGESKMSKARQFGTKELDEDGLLDLIKTLPAKKSKYEIEAEKQVKEKTPQRKSFNNNDSPPTEVTKPTSQKLQRFVKTTPEKRESNVTVTSSSSPATSSQMWVDKYKPASTKQIIGQQGAVKKLSKWLLDWHANRKLPKKPVSRFNDDGSQHRAALLSGPPGIGKTTSALLVSKEAGFSFIELNASCTRSKKSLKTEVAEALGNHTMVNYYGENGGSKSDRHCIIMDEVDGMAGNEDRGGMQELIQLIKTTKIPMICMCNDRNHPKVRSLANYCLDLRFQRPRLEQIKSAMMSIAFKEGLKIPPPALNDVIVASNQDIRQVIHNLSMWTAREKTPSHEQLKKDAASARKDLKIGPFDVCRKVFASSEETSKMTVNDKSDLFFQDYSIGPLFVQENYISVIPRSAQGSVARHLQCLSRAADSLSDGDLVDRHIRGGQTWSLLPLQAMFSSVLPGDAMRGHMGERIEFPSWLGKNSTTNKNNRLLQELKTHMRLKLCTDKAGLNLEYLPHLRQYLTEPLRTRGTDGVQQVIDLMDDYDLLREDFDSVLELSKWPGRTDPMSQVETKTKAAFTRTYNKEVHLTPYATTTGVKKGRGRRAGDDLQDEGAGPEEARPEEDSSEEKDDDPLADGMIKKSTAAKKTSKGDKGKTKASTSKTKTSKSRKK